MALLWQRSYHQVVLNVLLGATIIFLVRLSLVGVLGRFCDSLIIPGSFVENEVDFFKRLAASLGSVVSKLLAMVRTL